METCTDFLEEERQEIKVCGETGRNERKTSMIESWTHKGRRQGEEDGGGDDRMKAGRFFDYSSNEGISAGIPMGRACKYPVSFDHVWTKIASRRQGDRRIERGIRLRDRFHRSVFCNSGPKKVQLKRNFIHIIVTSVSFNEHWKLKYCVALLGFIFCFYWW